MWIEVHALLAPESVLYVNEDNIVAIHPESNTLILCGNHGGENGVLRIIDSDMSLLDRYLRYHDKITKLYYLK